MNKLAPVLTALLAATLTAVLVPAPTAQATSHKVDANGWTFTIVNTPTDGLAIVYAEFKGRRVFRRISVPQIRVLYGSNPTMTDQLGTSILASVKFIDGSLKTGIGANRIDVRARYEEHDWPNDHSYRYDVRYLFFADGEVRARVYAYGPGLEPVHYYDADFRIDIDVGGAGRDFFQHFRTNLWTAPKQECRCPTVGERDHGAEWLMFDGPRGTGWRIYPRTSDADPQLWAVRWKDGEGNTDLSSYTSPDTLQGNESLQHKNIVLWYRSHSRYERGPNCPGSCTNALIIGPIFRPFSF